MEARYAGYTLRQLLPKDGRSYARHNVKQRRKKRCSVNRISESQYESARGQLCSFRAARSNWFACRKAEGRIAAEGACLTRRGVLCVAFRVKSGRFCPALPAPPRRRINLLPGFAPELQGVYIEEHDGRKQVWCYVIKPRDAQRSR